VRAGGTRNHDGTDMTARAELSSVSTRLEELVKGVTDIADGLAGEERDRLSSDLYEVERTLRAAERRLRRVIDAGR
jgi:ElaB/YqjD/DUF883 family membrane-anchored ribosome-binding protein